MTNSVDPDQTASIGAVCSGSTLFASILNSSVILRNYLQQNTSVDDFSRGHFKVHFFSCYELVCISNEYNKLWTVRCTYQG